MKLQPLRASVSALAVVALPLSLGAAARADEHEAKDVLVAIDAFSKQMFFGTLSVEADYFLPPDSGKLSDAKLYDPARLPPQSAEHDRYKKLHERFLREAEEGTSFSATYDVTVGPYSFIRFERASTSDPDLPSVTVGRNRDGCWLVNEGDPVRYIWSGVPNPAAANPAYQRIGRLLYEAESEFDRLVRFGMASWHGHMIKSVSETEDGFSAKVKTADGDWEVRLIDWEGRLVVAERTLKNDDKITVYSYDQFVDAGGTLLPRYVLRTYRDSEQTTSRDQISRFEYRVVSITARLDGDWPEQFAPPAHGFVSDGIEYPYQFELDLDDGNAKPVSLRALGEDAPDAEGRPHQARSE